MTAPDTKAWPAAIKSRLSALLGYVQACEQRLLAEQPDAERATVGSPQSWSASALIAHNTDFRREQVIRLRAVAAGTEPPAFPQVDHRDPDTYLSYAGRDWTAVQAASAAVAADLITALDTVEENELSDPSRFPWIRGGLLWGQVLVRGAWHPLGHLADYLVAHQRAEQAASTVDGVIRTAMSLDIPAAPGGVAMAVYVLAGVHAVTGDVDRSLDLLGCAVADDPLLKDNAARDADFAALRDDPRFPWPLRA